LNEISKKIVMANKATTEIQDAGGDQRLHIEALLARYPDIHEDEVTEILEFHRSAPALETALLTCNDAVRDRYAQFQKDHSKYFGFRPRHYLLLAVILALIAIGTFYSWNAGL
jgi:hypothetical protein